MANEINPRPGTPTGSTVGTTSAAGATDATPASGGGAPANYGGGAPASNGRSTARGWEELAVADDNDAWRSRTRIVLMPTAPPSIMGLAGFAIATLMLGSWQAGWWGTATSPLGFWPFALAAGGILQTIAAVMSFRARDGIAVAAHTAWGAFWIAWGVYEILVQTGLTTGVKMGSVNDSFAIWFIGLGCITLSAFLGALAQSTLLSVTLGTLWAGASLTAAGFFSGTLWVDHIGGWLFVCSAAAAWVFVTAMVLEGSTGRTIIPLGHFRRFDANVPGRAATVPMAYAQGMPGSRVGQ